MKRFAIAALAAISLPGFSYAHAINFTSRKITFLIAAALFAIAPPALAHDAAGHPTHGDTVQRYGGHWRYMHRDWSTPNTRVPGVCWLWDTREDEWRWEC